MHSEELDEPSGGMLMRFSAASTDINGGTGMLISEQAYKFTS